MKLYGSLTNRLFENQASIPTIYVGMGVTEYLYSDREPYEVIQVKSQKNVVIRKLKAIAVGTPMSNDWKLESDSNGRTIELVYRYGNWWEKFHNIYTNKTDYRKYNKFVFGHADKYFDYEF